MATRAFPPGNARGAEVFQALLQKSRDGMYDEAFFDLVEQYRQMYPLSEKTSLFLAFCAMSEGYFDIAMEQAKEAEKKRRMSLPVWEILIACCSRRGDVREIVVYSGMARCFYQRPMHLSLSHDELEQFLSVLSRAMSAPLYAPLLTARAVWEDGVLSYRAGSFAGEFLPTLFRSEEWPYWAGAYIAEEPLNEKGWLLERVKDDPEFAAYQGAEFVFDLMRAKKVQEITFSVGNDTWLLPVAGLSAGQEAEFAGAMQAGSVPLAYKAFSFFRVDKEMKISSEEPWILGQPIRLGHSPRRHRLVLNILVDALSWGEIKREGYRAVPNLMRFFSSGIIFDNHYAAAEYTYPSLAGMETGLYMHRLQVFDNCFGGEIDGGIKTLSEGAAELGYYCVNVMGASEGVYNGVTRGFHRLIVNPNHLSSAEAVERTIHQIEAFDECDQYVFLHFSDTHTRSILMDALPLATQTHLPLEERLLGAEGEKTSVFLSERAIYSHANREGIRRVDRILGEFFSYLESRFAPEEYVVHLYSDHGVPVYEKEPYPTSENQACAALMLRGAGIPKIGRCAELVSGLDFYPIVAHSLGFSPSASIDGNLPKVLGGKEREYVVSSTQFPGQPYRVSIRTKLHECRMESVFPVTQEGTVNLAGAAIEIYTREGHEQVEDEELYRYFLSLLDDHTRSFNTEGHEWPEHFMEKVKESWHA